MKKLTNEELNEIIVNDPVIKQLVTRLEKIEELVAIVNNTFSTNEVVAYVDEEENGVEIETSVVERDPRLHLKPDESGDLIIIEEEGVTPQLVPFTTESLYAMIGRLSVDGLTLLMEENHVNTNSIDSVFEFLDHRIIEFYEVEPYEFQNFLDMADILHYEHMYEEDLENCLESEFYIYDGLEYHSLTDDFVNEIVARFYDNHIANAIIKGGEKYV